MKQILDFIPLIAFFVAFKKYDILVATQVLIVTTAIILIYSWVKYRKVEKMTIVTFVMVAVFGALTLYFQDERFIIWKVSVIYGLFALALIITPFIIKQTLLQRSLGKELVLPAPIWKKLNMIWVAFFAICALINIYIGFNYPLNIWVAFKTFVFPGLMLVNMIISIAYIYRFLPKQTSDKTQK